MARFAAILSVIVLGEEAEGQGRRRSPLPAPSPAPTPPASFEALIQQQVDTVTQHFKAEFPDMVVSAAWRDATRDVAVASGTVFDRPATADDTFLYGSGTKPFVSVAVQRLVDSGRVKVDDLAIKYLNPYMKSHGHPTLEQYFGDAVKNTTVLDLVNMQSGIRDFEDDYSFDVWVLGNGSKFWDYPYEAMSFAVSDTNTKGGAPLYFAPGTGMAYTSTGFEVAGLLLAAVLAPEKEWYEFDLATALFKDRSEYPSMHFAPQGRGEKLSKHLTVPGQSVASTWPKTRIYDQDASVLGFSCGNMIASPRDVAKFFGHVLDTDVPDHLISAASVARMKNFVTATAGWHAGILKYGAGLMSLDYGSRRVKQNHVQVFGHEGDTYGFVSSQGYAPELKGSYSVVTNVDADGPMYMATCLVLQNVKSVVTGLAVDMGCSKFGEQILV